MTGSWYRNYWNKVAQLKVLMVSFWGFFAHVFFAKFRYANRILCYISHFLGEIVCFEI